MASAEQLNLIPKQING